MPPPLPGAGVGTVAGTGTGTGAHNSRPSAFPIDQHHIASSNATASSFLGGRQPSWLAPGAPPTRKQSVSRPTSASRSSVLRPPAVPAIQHQAQQ